MKQYDTVIIGDVHGDFGKLNSFVNRGRPRLILAAGDFGYWPRITQDALYGRSNHRYPKELPAPRIPEGCEVRWCDGNHEDHYALGTRTTDELWPRVHYQPRRSAMTLPDGRVVLFMGGALSVDRHHRILGSGSYGWFQEEQVKESDVMDLPYDRIDVVISHTCPLEFDVHERYDYNDSSRTALSYILHKHRPKQWYCGHWHHYRRGTYLDCRWTALGRFDAPGPGGWIELKP